MLYSQKKLYILRLFFWVYMGLGYSTHFLKSSDSVIRNTLPGYITKQSKKDGNGQETIQSSTTPDPGYHMGQ